MNPQQRKALKARAHALNPVVFIGDKGLTDSLIAEIDRALTSHELIKIRAAGLERGARESALSEIASRCGGEPVQLIGKILVVYRPRPEEPAPEHRAPVSRKPPSPRRRGAARR